MSLADQVNEHAGMANAAVEDAKLLALNQTTRTLFNNDVLEHWAATRKAISQAAQKDDGTALRVEYPSDMGVVRHPANPMEFPREVILQEWEGQVQEVLARTFTARLVDLTSKESEETEEVDLPLDDLSESDKASIAPGSIFRWIIGHRYRDGEKERFTRVIVRRLPIWTAQEIRAADEEAESLHKSLFGDSQDRAAASRSG